MERVLKNIEKKIRYIKKAFKVNEVLSTQIYLYSYIFFNILFIYFYIFLYIFYILFYL